MIYIAVWFAIALIFTAVHYIEPELVGGRWVLALPFLIIGHLLVMGARCTLWLGYKIEG